MANRVGHRTCVRHQHFLERSAYPSAHHRRAVIGEELFEFDSTEVMVPTPNNQRFFLFFIFFCNCRPNLPVRCSYELETNPRSNSRGHRLLIAKYYMAQKRAIRRQNFFYLRQFLRSYFLTGRSISKGQVDKLPIKSVSQVAKRSSTYISC